MLRSGGISFGLSGAQAYSEAQDIEMSKSREQMNPARRSRQNEKGGTLLVFVLVLGLLLLVAAAMARLLGTDTMALLRTVTGWL
jgi:hypothetical protein